MLLKWLKNETKAQRAGYIGLLLGTLGASFLGNMWADKCVIRADYEVILTGNEVFGSKQGL